MVEPRLSVRRAKARDRTGWLGARTARSPTWLSARWNPMRFGKPVVSRRRRSAYGVEIDLEAAIRGPRQVDAELGSSLLPDSFPRR